MRESVVDGVQLLQVWVSAGEKEALNTLVFQAVEEGSAGRMSIAPSTAGFLEVGFQRVGKLEVIDETNIRLIDA